MLDTKLGDLLYDWLKEASDEKLKDLIKSRDAAQQEWEAICDNLREDDYIRQVQRYASTTLFDRENKIDSKLS